ncbi:hypothetical protein GX411_02530 [Candidatus Fermentibacteria bacterium]|nr:hypothetical protein [Candidatus Fermentibacteria bacterium]
MKAGRLLASILLLAIAATGCGQRPGTDQAVVDEPVVVVESPEVSGWMDVSLPGGAPAAFACDAEGAWACFDGGIVLRCNLADCGRWSSFDLGLGDADMIVIDAVSDGGRLLMLTSAGLVEFAGTGDEASVTAVPEGFNPVSMALDAGETALLGSDGSIALETGDGFEIARPGEPRSPASSLVKYGLDWAYLASDSTLARYDDDVALWQVEKVPCTGTLATIDDRLYIGGPGSVLRREAVGEWTEAFPGHLCRGGLALTDAGVVGCSSPGEPLAAAPSTVPDLLCRSGEAGPVWAVDESGILAWSDIGGIETRMPAWDMQRIECTMAGQTGAGSTPPSTPGMTPLLTAASGAFRIYESVSSRPDPFAEFPPRRRDLRRPLGEIAIEELHLVGITLDPSGGNQAMVEDASGVPYILYVNSELANNTRVADITSNEVIVIQEVTVDYGPERGGVASIPTIYSMRLHEEGGL